MKRTVIFGLLFGLILLGARLLPHSPAEATIEPDNGLARPMSIEKLLQINNPGPGELYFKFWSSSEGEENGSIQLARLPGVCILEDKPCPSPEIISTPFNPQEMGSMDWSPDGRYGLTFIRQYEAQENSAAGLVQTGPSKIYLFDAAQESWTLLHEFNGDLDGGYLGSSWSADGNWIAFFQDSIPTGEAGLHLIRPDGSDLKQVMKSASKRFGWANNVLLHQQFERDRGSRRSIISRINPISGEVTQLFEGERNAMAYPSPLGDMIAFADFHAGDDPTPIKKISLLAMDGEPLSELADFPNQNEGIWPVSWSPDGSYLAFSLAGNVYLAAPSTEPKLIYQAATGIEPATVRHILFSPDNRHLLIDSYQGFPIFVTIDLDSMENATLGWEGFNKFEDQPMQPSWRPG